MKKDIHYISHQYIDKTRWDNRIQEAPNGLIYASSAYLDFMSPGWDALVMRDYETIMPLTIREKWGISYLYQPAFCQQLGVFGNATEDEAVTRAFLEIAGEHFPFIEINLNFANEYKKVTKKKCNLILSLNQPFHQIEKSFKKDLIQNIRKAKKNNVVYQESDEIKKAIDLYKNTYSKRFYIAHKDFENFLNLCIYLKGKDKLIIRKVSSADGELLAIGIFLKDDKRIYKVMTTTLPNGRQTGANHFLLHELIKEYSDQNLIFDFFGSEIPSINFFCRKFGPVEQRYSLVKINQLPFLTKELKALSDYLRKQKFHS